MFENFPIKISLTLLVALFVMFVFSPLLHNIFAGLGLLEYYAKYMGSKICHQHESKLFRFQGINSVVCFRCTGIYFGGFIASLINLILRKTPAHKFLLLGFIPILLDVILINVGIYSYSGITAFLTGFILGCAAFFYLYMSLVILFNELRTRKSE